MTDAPLMDSPPPVLTPHEEKKVETILNLVDEELGTVPNKQQINILYHVIGDLFGTRLAAIEAEKPLSQQENIRLAHRLKHVQKLFEEHQTSKRAPERSLLVDVKARQRKTAKDKEQGPPSR